MIASSWTEAKLKVEHVGLLTEVKTMLGKETHVFDRELRFPYRVP